MTVTFGTRSAMRELADELEEGEAVLELAACAYAGAAGLVALTSERVLAIRDDYSKHQVQFARIPEVVWIDYLPKVHDGFAIFTATGRVVVRKMRRADGDRLVDALLERAPHIEVRPTCPIPDANPGPGPRAAASPAPLRSRLGRHRKPVPSAPDAVAAAGAQGQVAAAVAQAPGGRTDPSGHTVTPAATPPPAAQADAAAEPAEAAPRPVTDREILLGVLADLHAQGALSAEEFAAKVRQIVAPD